MKLSLCIATYNEEAFIHYPLDSVYDLVDEVVIVDGGSKDKTVKIAKSYGKKVRMIKTTNPPMFHINKQKAIEGAKGDWILQLDADEALSPELKREINKVIKGIKPVAYWIPRKNFFLGRFLTKGGVYPDYTIRLYRNGVAHFPCKSVHENVKVKGKIGHLKNPLLHYADPTFTRYLKRWQRYTSLDAKTLLEENKSPGFFSYFFVKPLTWFFSSYFRHAGFMDGFQGFVFAFFSSIRFWAIYTKWWRMVIADR
jgi:glycosyltransferase involved in cell wall biosynthesis